MVCQIKRRNQKKKFVHRIITALVITSLVIIFWKYLNHQREFKRINKEKTILFDKILEPRYLQEKIEENIYEESFDKICAKGHEELQEYYKTGNLDIIYGIEDQFLIYKKKDKDKTQIKSLINIIQFLTNKENEKNKNLLYIDSTKNDIITYFNHNATAIFFCVIGAMTIPGWILLFICSLSRFNFFCCDCLKKNEFKSYFFIFIIILYLLAFFISFYGLIKSNLIYTDISDIECSIYKFFEQTFEGGSKETYPKWIGLNNFYKTLNELYIQIEQIESKTLIDLNQKIDNINNKKINFKNKMEESGNEFYSSPDSNIYSNLYSNEYDIDSRGISGRYVLDIVKMFGKKVTGISEEKYEPENSTLDLWHNEYKLISKKADEYFEKAINDLKIISNKSVNFGKVIENISILKDFLLLFMKILNIVY